MLTIGITGPTGSGKTTALKALEDLGFLVLDCDAVYHRMLRTDADLRGALSRRFGSDIFHEDGLDRQKLGNLVWNDKKALADLNQITHKEIIRKLREELEQAEAAGKLGAAIDAIALFESGAGALCHVSVAVIAPEEFRVGRIMKRDGIDREYALARMRAQKPAEWFSSQCSYTLMNDGTQEEFYAKSMELFRTILEKT